MVKSVAMERTIHLKFGAPSSLHSSPSPCILSKWSTFSLKSLRSTHGGSGFSLEMSGACKVVQTDDDMTMRVKRVQRAVPHKHNQSVTPHLKRDPYLLRSPSFSLASAFLLGSVVDKGVSLAKYSQRTITTTQDVLTLDMRFILYNVP